MDTEQTIQPLSRYHARCTTFIPPLRSNIGSLTGHTGLLSTGAADTAAKKPTLRVSFEQGVNSDVMLLFFTPLNHADLVVFLLFHQEETGHTYLTYRMYIALTADIHLFKL
jgi:hypothetical protein